MTHPPIPAVAMLTLDSGVGLSITTLVVSLGAACAVILVTRYFLEFLDNQQNGQGWFIENFRRHHAASQRKFQEQVDRLSNRQIRNQHDFQDQIDRMTASQSVILRDAIATMNRMESAVGGSMATIRGIEAGMGSLSLTIRNIEQVLTSMTENRIPAESSLSSKGCVQ